MSWRAKLANHDQPIESTPRPNLLVTDFDGTMTQDDFYQCVVQQLLTPEDLSPWRDYTDGKLSHFEALRRIFAKIQTSEEELLAVVAGMGFDSNAADAITQLRTNGWHVTVVSNGCRWYIDHLLERDGIQVEVHSNPGDFLPESGLLLKLPSDSPYFSEEVGISKAKVVSEALKSGRYGQVAFAGDGRPDIEAALLVEPQFRFARAWLGEALSQRNEQFHRFEAWSEIAHMLQGSC